jgi:hypothetical protein
LRCGSVRVIHRAHAHYGVISFMSIIGTAFY